MDEEARKKHTKPETGAAPGVYKHPDTKDELHASSFTQADAFVRQGWEYDRPLPKLEVRSAEEQANDLLDGQTKTQTPEGGETYDPKASK